jgi:hypothetical protein
MTPNVRTAVGIGRVNNQAVHSAFSGKLLFMPALKSYLATSIGRRAFIALAREQIATVLNLTSQGAFLQTPARRILFLSGEPYRGPLTINSDLALLRHPWLNTGELVYWRNSELVFPAAGIGLSIPANAVWCPPTPGHLRMADLRLLEQLQLSARIMIERQAGQGFSRLLAPILNLPTQAPLSTDQKLILACLLRLRQALAADDIAEALAQVDQLLGRGYGLTPSGDDVTLGLLLALSCGAGTPESRSPQQTFTAQVVNLAHQKTTALSADLIECAAQGEADERLLRALDDVLSDAPLAYQNVLDLLTWGNTSGADVWLGIALALTSNACLAPSVTG